MRTIKFRAFDESLGMFYIEHGTDFTIELGNHKPIVHIYSSDGVIDYFQPENIMQYTGLKDKNGKEIYEGDIVNYQWIKEYTAQEVVWDIENVRWGFRDLKEDRPYGVNSPDIASRAEVIGNIYENPELMN